MSDIPHLNFRQLLTELGKQEFIVHKTTKGVRVYGPNGGPDNSTIIHKSSVEGGNHRTWLNITTKLRSMGFVTPEERKAQEKDFAEVYSDGMPEDGTFVRDGKLYHKPPPELRPPTRWITIKDAAEILGVTPTYMHLLVKKRELDVKYDKTGSDGRLMGKRVRFSDIEALTDRPRKPQGGPMPRTRTSTGRRLKEQAPRVVVIKPDKFEKAIEHLAEAVDLLRQAFITPKEVDEEKAT